MKNHCATIVLVLLVISIFCCNSYATAQESNQKQVKSMPWLSLLLKSDYSLYFSKIPTSSTVIMGDFYVPPSSFALRITNNSTRVFTLTRAELRNSSSIIAYTVDPAFLSGGQLAPREFVNVGFGIKEPEPVEGIKLIYHLVDPITGKPFTVSYEW